MSSCSVQFVGLGDIYTLSKSSYALHCPIFPRFPKCSFWNSFHISQTDNGLISSFPGRPSTPAVSLPRSDDRWPDVLCFAQPSVVSEMSIRSAPHPTPLGSSMSKTVDPKGWDSKDGGSEQLWGQLWLPHYHRSGNSSQLAHATRKCSRDQKKNFNWAFSFLNAPVIWFVSQIR